MLSSFYLLLAHPKKRRSAFTLVELLVVVLILAILMAIALPLYLTSVREAARRTVRSNLQTLINAEQAFLLESSNRTYTSKLSDLKDVNQQGVMLSGPSNTEYSLYTSGTLPDNRQVPDHGVAACAKNTFTGSFADYGCFIPGVDSE